MISDLQAMVDAKGFCQGLDTYRPVTLLGVGSASSSAAGGQHSGIQGARFIGIFIVTFMTRIALSGKFNIAKSIYGLPELPNSATSRIKVPARPWATGMLLVSSLSAS
jgi:hypothetical protein